MSELYHYTTVAGFLGMLEVTGSKKDSKSEPTTDLTMRATHCNYMNDRSEFFWGIQLCNKAIRDYEKRNKVSKEISLQKYLKDPYSESNTWSLLYFSSHIDSIDYGYPYLISFSGAKDSIPMWGMYAQKGGGIALVFDRDRLEGRFSADKYKDCIYCNDGDTDLLMGYIERKYKEFIKVNDAKKVDAPRGKMKRMRAMARIHEIYREICPYVKHKSFEYEKEFRIVVSNPKPISYEFGDEHSLSDHYSQQHSNPSSAAIYFREKDGLIIPFVHQKIPVDYLKGIVVGPTADFIRMKDALTILLKNKGVDISKIDIIKSEVPYRG